MSDQQFGLNTTFWVLLILAAVLILAGWFFWMRRGPKETPTSPGSPSTQLQVRYSTHA